MTPERYTDFVRAGNFTKDDRDSKFLAGLGLAGEAGEVADIIKKHLLHGAHLDRDALCKELGDVMWYLQHAIEVFGFTDAEVKETNVRKLCDRYPEGYGSPSKWLEPPKPQAPAADPYYHPDPEIHKARIEDALNRNI